MRPSSGGLSGGQRRLIFSLAARVGLRAEQLRDLAECSSSYRTRAIATLTVWEARRLIVTMKTLERNAGRAAKPAEPRRGAAG